MAAQDSSAANAWVDSYLDAREWEGGQGLLLPAASRRRRQRQLVDPLLPLGAPRPAVLSYGLSSEYLTSTKEAKAKSKTIDADRSLYR